MIHNIVKSCNGLMKKFLKEYAPELSKIKIIFHHVTYSTDILTVENFFKKLDKKIDLTDKVIVMDSLTNLILLRRH